MNCVLICRHVFVGALLFLFAPNVILAQSVDEIKADRERYLWGEGTGTTLKKADDGALADLISQISVDVQSSFDNEVIEIRKKSSDGGDDAVFQQTVNSIISTYSNAALTNTDRIVVKNEPDARVLRYILRSDVSKVFEQRREKIVDFVNIAEKHEQEARLADALRYYNWALVLLRSHPDAKSIRSDRANAPADMHAFITGRINSILDDIQFSVVDLHDEAGHREVNLITMFRGAPAANLDYSFWFGTDWSRLHSVKDGRTLIDFFGDNAQQWEKTNFRIEYAYTDQLFGDKELEEVYRRLDPVFFPKASREVNFNRGRTELVKPITLKADDIAIKHRLVTVDNKLYKAVVDVIISATRNRKAEEAKPFFQPEAYEVYEQLLLYGKARLVDDQNFEVFQHGDDFVARGTYMSFDFSSGHKSFVEEVVFHFDRDQKITSVVFGLGEIATKDIYDHPAWDEEEKFVLVDFMEQYKTAYCLKRLDYIERIFDDNALIITGTVLKKQAEIDGRPAVNMFANNQIVKYNRYSKREFMQRLEHVFRTKEFINLEFEDNTLRKSNANPNLFGIQIKQNYRSDNYSDQGYLFLLIDFADRSAPVIHVRTWQPDKDDDGRIYGLEDF